MMAHKIQQQTSTTVQAIVAILKYPLPDGLNSFPSSIRAGNLTCIYSLAAAITGSEQLTEEENPMPISSAETGATESIQQ